MAEIKEHMKIFGKTAPMSGLLTVDSDRIKLAKKDSPAGHEGHHHYIGRMFVGGRR